MLYFKEEESRIKLLAFAVEIIPHLSLLARALCYNLLE